MINFEGRELSGASNVTPLSILFVFISGPQNEVVMSLEQIIYESNVFISGSFYQPRTKTQVPSYDLPVNGRGGSSRFKT